MADDEGTLSDPRRSQVAILLKGYPRLSETFIAQEILGLERAGLDLRLYSMRHPTDAKTHPVHDEIRAPVVYLPEYLHDDLGRVRRAWSRVRGWPGYSAARRAWLRDLKRDVSRNRVRRFGQAVVLAAELPAEIGRIHAHFLHTPASVARYAALIAGLPWSCSAHAKDIWTTPDWELREKLVEIDWLVTCTRFGRDHLASLAPPDRQDRVALVYHGLDFDRFPTPPDRDWSATGSDPDRPVRLLTIGRAVPKKGFDTLLEALALLPDHLHWRLDHIGGGAERERLQGMAHGLRLDDRIAWHGAQAHGAVMEAIREADLFLLPSRVAPDGDRDGLPNVLMEAQSQALPCLSTALPGISELILSEETGLLVPPDDPQTLAWGLTRLIEDPALRQRLGEAGCERVRAAFAFRAGLDQLMRWFGHDPDDEDGPEAREAAQPTATARDAAAHEPPARVAPTREAPAREAKVGGRSA